MSRPWPVWLTWLEHRPSWIPCQGTYLGYGFGLQLGYLQKATNWCFSPSLSPSLLLSLKSVRMSSCEEINTQTNKHPGELVSTHGYPRSSVPPIHSPISWSTEDDLNDSLRVVNDCQLLYSTLRQKACSQITILNSHYKKSKKELNK